MRMRKKTWAEPFINEHRDYIIEKPEDFKGKWREVLGCTGLLHVEIGCGKGDYFIGMHQKYPQDGFVAIEKDTSCAAVAAKKALNGDHSSTIMINKDACELEQWFDEHEIDIIHLNFSDPWPKKGHAKRRLSSKSFLDKYKSLLSENGEIQMKTDNQKLFEYSVAEFSQNGWIIDEISVNYRAEGNDGDTMTEYETRFVELGQPIYRMVLKNRGKTV